MMVSDQKEQFTRDAYQYFNDNIRPIKTYINEDGKIRPQKGQGGQNDDVDAFRHAYTSARFTQEYSADFANALGLANEINPSFSTRNIPARNMDLWNNSVGRASLLGASSTDEIGANVKAALMRGDLITSLSDTRQFPDDGNSRADDFLNALEALGSDLQDSIMDYAQELQALINSSPLENVVIGGDGDNLLVGARDKPSAYYIPQLNGQNIINDFDGNGVIKIGNPPVVLQGNATPKKDASGNIIEGQWTLNGYNLIRSGNNMVIILAGSDVSSADTPRITINNFPFSNPNAFGLTLGKVQTGEFDGVELVRREISSAIFATKDRRGRFFAVTNSAAGLRITNYDANANNLGSQDICPHLVNYITTIWSGADSEQFINGAWVLENHQLLMPFQASSGEAGSRLFSLGIARVDVDSGKIVTSRIVKEWQEGSGVAINFNNAGLAGYGSSHYALRFDVRSTIDSSRRNEVFKIDKRSLAQIGETEIYYAPFPEYCNNGLVPGLDCPSPAGGLGRLNQVQEISLANGGKAFLRPLVEDIDLVMFIPKLRDMTQAEIPDSKSLPAGATQSASGIQQGIITFQDAVDAATAAELQMTPIANQRLVINGLDNGYVDLSEFHFTEQQIAERTTQVDASQYSMEDLLAGRYNPSALRRRDAGDTKEAEIDLSKLLSRGKEAGLEVDEAELEERARRDANDDDYQEPSQDLIDKALTESPEVFSVLNLDNNQLLIFPGIGREEFLNRTADFFIGYIPDEVTTVEHNSTAPWTTVRPLNFTTSSSQIDGYTPPQIGNETQSGSNPLAPGSLGFGFLVGAGILFAGGVVVGAYKLATSEETRTSLRDGIVRVGGSVVNFFDPRNWTRASRTHPQGERVGGDVERGARLEVVTSRTDNPLEDPAIDNTTIVNEFFVESEIGERPRAPSSNASLRGDVVRVASDELQRI